MIMAALLAIAPGYASGQPTGKKGAPPATQPKASVPGEPAGAAKSYTPEARKAYEQNTAKELDKVHETINELRVKATTGARQKQRLILRTANNLQFQTYAARDQLTALEQAPEAAWGAEKAKLDKAMADLRKAWEAAQAHLN
jgi:hypothetical protein